MVSAPGIGSGLDINGLVSQLVAAERQPVANRINLAEVRTNSELSALGKLKSAIASFQDTLETLKEIDNFQQRTVSQDNEDFVSVSADSSAVKGSYDIQVLALATAHKLSSPAYTDAATPVGTGTLTIANAAGSMAVTITDEASTLADIADAINDADDNPGVLATVINSDAGSHLLISAAETGGVNQLTITSSGGNGGLTSLEFDPLAGSNPMVEREAAGDSVILIDGLPVSGPSNSVDDAVEGLSISLLQAEIGTETRVTIDYDETAANAALTAFVQAHNALISTIDEVTAYDAETGVAGALLGDSIVRDLKESLRRELNSVVSVTGAPFSMLVDIGITTNLEGRLEIDSSVSGDAIALDFDAVGELFADAEQGIAVRLDAFVTTLLESDGSISLREERLNDRLADLTDQRERLDDRMLLVEERYFKQFQALDTLLAQFQSTSAYLTQQLANIPVPGSSSGDS